MTARLIFLWALLGGASTVSALLKPADAMVKSWHWAESSVRAGSPTPIAPAPATSVAVVVDEVQREVDLEAAGLDAALATGRIRQPRPMRVDRPSSLVARHSLLALSPGLRC